MALNAPGTCSRSGSSAAIRAGASARSRRDAELAKVFGPFAESLTQAEQTIVGELNAVQGNPADIGGYYRPDPAKAATVMRPSTTWNTALATLS